VNLTPHFTLHEFRCKDGTPVPDGYVLNAITIARILEVIRAAANRQFPAAVERTLTIRSAFRTVKYNRGCGGAKFSQHLTCSATDIIIAGLTPDCVADLCERLVVEGKIKIGGLGRYDAFTHIDTRKRRTRWDNRSDGKRG
jgi:uncharacterized protein YcbK (DUF882 family)